MFTARHWLCLEQLRRVGVDALTMDGRGALLEEYQAVLRPLEALFCGSGFLRLGADVSCLDGDFTADELRQIAGLMDQARLLPECRRFLAVMAEGDLVPEVGP